MICFDENTVLAFLSGRVPAEERAEIERHLDHCNDCLELVSVAGSRTAKMDRSVQRGLFTTSPRPRGSSIGRYVILDRVGRGGMGEVYAAYHPDLDRRIALKLLDETRHAGHDAEQASARLLREAKVIAKLSHPNVVVVHDAGTIDDRVFIAMEFVHGQTLSEWLSQPRTWPQIREVFLAAGRGLAAAHAAGVVHRDFKPQNVMVGEGGAVRVMDFGLAREVVIASEEGGEGTPDDSALAPAALTLTRTGTWLGTPLYMAPEQFRAEKADARTDQFSFCVALHEAVYGERPFSSESLPQLREAVAAGNIRPPPPRNRVPAWLRRVILRGLSADRAARFPSMAELLAALERDPTRTRRRILAGSLVALLLLAVGAVAQKTAARPAMTLCQEAGEKLSGIWELASGEGERPRRTASQRAFLATGQSHAASTWERAARRLDGFAQRWLRMHKQSCEATHKIGEQSAAVLDLRTDCLNTALQGLRATTDLFVSADAEILSSAVAAAEALPDLNRCADIRLLRALVSPPTDPGQAARIESLRRQAAAARALGDTGKWNQSLAAARKLVEEARSPGHAPILAEALFLRGTAEAQMGNPTAAVASLKEALPAAVTARDDLVAAQVAVNLSATILNAFDRPDEGDPWADLAEAYLGHTGVGGDRTRAWLAQARGQSHLLRGRFGEAVALKQQAVALTRKAMGHDGIDVAIGYNNLAVGMLANGDAASALKETIQGIEIVEKDAGPESPTLGALLTNQGEILNALGRPDEALPVFQRCMEVWRSSVLPDSPWFAYPLTGIGQSLLLQHKPEQARAPLERALALRTDGDPSPERLGETRFALARALWDSDRGRDRPRALRLAQAARRDHAKKPAAQGQVAQQKIAEIESWLQSHSLRRR